MCRPHLRCHAPPAPRGMPSVRKCEAACPSASFVPFLPHLHLVSIYHLTGCACASVQIFWNVHHAFAVVRSRATEGRCTLQMVLVIAEKLDVLRKMVSSACGVPLPVDMKEDSKLIIPFDVAVFPEDGVEASAQLPFSFVPDAMNLVKATT